jgi:ribonuclease P protein component
VIERVRSRATFDALRREGRRARHGPVTVTYVPDDASSARVAFAIGRKVGNAVVRNRVRRRLRAILRELDRSEGPGLVPGAYLVSVRPEAATLPYQRLTDHVTTACARAGAKDGTR